MDPIYRQALFIPPQFPIDPDAPVDTSIHELTWHLRGQFPYEGFTNPQYFVCMQAYEACGDVRRCRTPTFIGDHIPEAIIQWMSTYADILSVGMILGRRK